MRKALEKQIKTTEDQVEKQIKIIKENKKQPAVNDYGNGLLISKEREMFKNTYSKRLAKIEELTEKINKK